MQADQGVSGERTSGAWGRTALAIVTGVMAVLRLSLDRLTPLAVTFLTMTLGAGLGVILTRPTAAETGRPLSRPRADGCRLALAALAVFGLAVSELVCDLQQ